MPLTGTHGGLYYNRARLQQRLGELDAAVASINRAIALFERLPDADLVDRPDLRRALARAWRVRGDIVTAPEDREQAFARAIAVLEPHLDDLEIELALAETLHWIGAQLRLETQFAEALRYESRAVETMEDVLDKERTPQHRTLLAGYRGGWLLALGGAGHLAAAVEDAPEVIDALSTALDESDDAGARAILESLRTQLTAWRKQLSPDTAYAEACSFCERDRRQVTRMLVGIDAAICATCLDEGLGIVDHGWPRDPDTKQRSGEPRRTPNRRRCSFCDSDERRAFIGADTVVICDHCIDVSALLATKVSAR